MPLEVVFKLYSRTLHYASKTIVEIKDVRPFENLQFAVNSLLFDKVMCCPAGRDTLCILKQHWCPYMFVYYTRKTNLAYYILSFRFGLSNKSMWNEDCFKGRGSFIELLSDMLSCSINVMCFIKVFRIVTCTLCLSSQARSLQVSN